jgi:hypothetical protein
MRSNRLGGDIRIRIRYFPSYSRHNNLIFWDEVTLKLTEKYEEQGVLQMICFFAQKPEPPKITIQSNKKPTIT